MFSLREISDAVERFKLREFAASFSEEEATKRNLLSYSPPEERIARGLSDRELLIVLAVESSPIEFARNFDSYQAECESFGEAIDAPERCVSPVVRYHFSAVDAVLEQTKAYQQLAFKLEHEYQEVKERLRINAVEDDDFSAEQANEWEEFWRAYHTAIEDFLDSQTLPPISDEAILVWQDWALLDRSLILPAHLAAGRQLLVKETAAAIEEIEKQTSSTPPLRTTCMSGDLDTAVFENKRAKVDEWIEQGFIPILDLDEEANCFLETLIQEPCNECDLADMQIALGRKKKFTNGAARGIQNKLHNFLAEERIPLKIHIRENKELDTHTIKLIKLDKNQWLSACRR